MKVSLKPETEMKVHMSEKYQRITDARTACKGLFTYSQNRRSSLTFDVFWSKHLQEVRSTVYIHVQSI